MDIETPKGPEAKGTESKGTLEINYRKAAADAINKVKQDLATNEIEQRLKQEIENSKEMSRFQQKESNQR